MLYPLSYGRVAPKGLTESSVVRPSIEIGPELPDFCSASASHHLSYM